MPKRFSLYPPLLALAMLGVGVGLYSVPAALIVCGGFVLAAWIVHVAAWMRK